MAVVNRDLDASEQKLVLNAPIGLLGTAATFALALVPYPATLKAVQVAANGLSGSPFWNIEVHRFIAGSGFTAISPGGTLTVAAMGTSGVQGVSLVASGSSLLNLITNDVIAVRTGAANTAVLNGVVSVAVQALQDVKAVYGSSS